MSHIEFYKVRKVLGLTQAEMGALLGMSSVNVHYIERGQSSLSEHHETTLRDELGITNERKAQLIKQYDELNGLVGDKARALHKIRQRKGEIN